MVNNKLRQNLEAVFYAIRPFLIYAILFATIRAILLRLLESLLLAAGSDMTIYYAKYHTLSMLLILALSAAGGILPVLKEGQREVMWMQHRSSRAWIRYRRDRKTLMMLMPAGTLATAFALNIPLSMAAGNTESAVEAPWLPLAAAVYGLMTPFTEELIYRGLMYGRLRQSCSIPAAAVFSAAVFGIAHGNIWQAIYGFCMGVLFALCYELTRNFAVPFLLHCLCNLATLLSSSGGLFGIFVSAFWEAFFITCAVAVWLYFGKRMRETGFK